MATERLVEAQPRRDPTRDPRNRNRRRWIAALAGAAVFALAMTWLYSLLFPTQPEISVRSHRLVGNELRIVLETSRVCSPVLAHSSTTRDASGWLVVVDLSSAAPLASCSRVFGPLWEVSNPRSTISFESGANFTRADDEAAAATPFVDLKPDGTLYRVRAVADGALARDRLVVEGDHASWQPDVAPARIQGLLTWPSEDQVDTLSKRFHLQRRGGSVLLYDFVTGREVDDPWLESAFAVCRAVPTLENITLWLTDDLRFLVCSPAPRWNKGNGIGYETFELGGTTYARAEYGFYFERPRAEPVVFKKARDEGSKYASAPDSAFSIGGELHLLYDTSEQLRLVPLEGGDGFQVAAPTGRAWEMCGLARAQHDERAGRLDFLSVEYYGAELEPGDAIELFVWDYRRGTMTQHEVRLDGLFTRRGSRFEPRRVVKVDSSGR